MSNGKIATGAARPGNRNAPMGSSVVVGQNPTGSNKAGKNAGYTGGPKSGYEHCYHTGSKKPT